MYHIPIILFGLTPLYLVRFGVFGIPTTLFEALLYIAFFIASAQASRKGAFKELFSLPREHMFRAGLLLLVLGVIFSVALNPTLRSLGIIKGWFLDPFLMFLLIRNAGDNVRRKLFSAYAVSGLCVALIALGYVFAGSVTYDGRLRAFFESPNHLAMYLAPAALIMLWRFVVTSSKQKRILFGMALVSLLAVLYLTGSFGAWVGVVGALVLGLFVPRLTAKFRVIVIVIVIVGGALTPFLATRFWPFLQEMFYVPERSSASSRMMIWRSALVIGKDNTVFGIGPGNFQDRYLAEQKNYPPYLEWAVPQPHNIYLAFWLQTSLLGLVGFLLLLWWFFKQTLDNWTLDLGHLAFIVILYILLHGAVDTLYWKNDLSVVFWGLLAIASLQSVSHSSMSSGSDKS
ncbi:MAG: O-antigen ligase family protein [bacterium]|nr:O-antigen ligase family protein [bacterium]